MTESTNLQHPLVTENNAFFEKTERVFRDLFDRARDKNELQFAFSLNPEFRGEQDAGWSTADDAHLAFDEYLAFLMKGEFTSLKARVALAFYCHLAEASGYYEIPKNMLRVVGGQPYNLWPSGIWSRRTGRLAPSSRRTQTKSSGISQGMRRALVYLSWRKSSVTRLTRIYGMPTLMLTILERWPSAPEAQRRFPSEGVVGGVPGLL